MKKQFQIPEPSGPVIEVPARATIVIVDDKGNRGRIMGAVIVDEATGDMGVQGEEGADPLMLFLNAALGVRLREMEQAMMAAMGHRSSPLGAAGFVVPGNRKP